jgi:hypothetical protein
LIQPQLALSFVTAGLAGAGALCAGIPILIHLLTRFRRRPQPWGAMKFLFEAYKRHRTRLQLEQWILLAVRCLVLLILGLALAGPLMKLGGCANNVGPDAGGRVVYLVIDDSLSSQTVEHFSDSVGAVDAGLDTNATQDSTATKTRFEIQRQLALKLVDSLSPTDQVAIVHTARPIDPTATPPTVDRTLLRKHLRDMHVQAGRCDLAAALKVVQQSVERQNTQADRVYVMVLSDYTRDAISPDRPITDALKSLSTKARIVSTKPALGTANIQIASLKPRRHLVVTDVDDGAGAVGSSSVPVDIELRRFEDSRASRVTQVTISMFVDNPTKPIAPPEKNIHKWQAGETKVTIRATLPIYQETLDALGVNEQTNRRNAIGSVVLRGQIEPDALELDNQRFATIELRKRLRVGLIDDVAAGGDRSGSSGKNNGIGGAAVQELSPHQYVHNALRTDEKINSGFDLQQLPAIDVDKDQLHSLDAAVVLRPDLLSDLAWRGLHDLAQRGGVVWIFAPITGGPAQWNEALRSRLGVPWELEIDPKIALESSNKTKDQIKNQTSDNTIGLDLNRAVPEFHQLQATVWSALLKPVRISKYYSLINSTSISADHIWIATATGKPLLVAQSVGQGHVLLWTTALGRSWTNLHVKPLFVALLGESLQSAVAQSAAAGQTANTVIGDLPALGSGWDGASQLISLSQQDKAGVLLRRTTSGFVPVKPLTQPGVYQAAPTAQGRMIPVNIEPVAGDTTGISEQQVTNWLNALGKVTWIDQNDPGATFASFETNANIGFWLLWLTLMLVVLELVLARLFSHAKRDESVGIGAMVAGRFAGITKSNA